MQQNMQIREYIGNLDRSLILGIHCLCDHCLGPSGHVASDGLRCPAQTGRRLECAWHYYRGRRNFPGQPCASPSSPKQILTVREGAASSSSLMNCESSCSQTAAPTSVWLGPHSGCQASGRDPSSPRRVVREG